MVANAFSSKAVRSLLFIQNKYKSIIAWFKNPDRSFKSLGNHVYGRSELRNDTTTIVAEHQAFGSEDTDFADVCGLFVNIAGFITWYKQKNPKTPKGVFKDFVFNIGAHQGGVGSRV